jgi:hypothetical protein
MKVLSSTFINLGLLFKEYHVRFLCYWESYDKVNSYALDGAYDSFTNYADIWNYLNVNPTISSL